MGLGKTATVLQALTPDHLPALVAAPKRVAEEVWHVEVEKWRPDLSVRTLTKIGPTKAFPSGPERRRHLLSDGGAADITVITRDMLGDFGTRQHPYKTVVLDELSAFKTKSTGRWKAARDMKRNATYLWGLTGTPAPNGYMDLFAQVYLLDEGARLGKTLTAFRDRYFNPGRRDPVTNIVYEWNLKPGAKESIDRAIADLCLTMKAEDYLDMPDLTFNPITVPMPRLATKAYKDLADTMVADISILGAVHASANAATLTNKLQQVTAGFLYDDVLGAAGPVTALHDEKVKALKEIVDGTGDNVLVFYWFEEERRRIMADKDLGAVSVNEKGAVARWNNGEIRVLLAHPASAGHGLNLQYGGHTVVWTTTTWNAEYWEQALGRLHRQGQKNAVVCHLLQGGPVDKAAFLRVQDKVAVQDALMFALREDHLLL